jgi:hypothetical protein
VKITKPLALAVATLAAGSSLLLSSGAASAAGADADASTQYVNDVAQIQDYDFGGQVAAGTWVADIESTTKEDAFTFGPDGLSTDGTTGAYLLTGTRASVPVASLAELIAEADFVSTGTAKFGFVIQTDGPDLRFSTATGTTGLEADATYDLGTSDGGAMTADQIEEDYAGTDATVSAYGFLLSYPERTPATVSSITVDGVTTRFTPTPTFTVAPGTVPAAALRTTGVAVSATGFLPGETVSTGYGTGRTGNALDATFVADANGAVTGTLVVPADAAGGDYTLTLVGTTSALRLQAALVVTADPAAPAPAAPAAGAGPSAIAPVATPVRAAASFTG